MLPRAVFLLATLRQASLIDLVLVLYQACPRVRNLLVRDLHALFLVLLVVIRITDKEVAYALPDAQRRRRSQNLPHGLGLRAITCCSGLRLHGALLSFLCLGPQSLRVRDRDPDSLVCRGSPLTSIDRGIRHSTLLLATPAQNHRQ